MLQVHAKITPPSPTPSCTFGTSMASFERRFPGNRRLQKTICGTVELARDAFTGNDVVVKRSSKLRLKGTESPSNEARILRKIQGKGGHKNIIGFIESAEDSKRVLLAMEFLSEDLMTALQKRNDALDTVGASLENEKMAQLIFAKLVSAMEFLHSLGVAHLDISPENVLVDAKGAVKLCDFGNSRQVVHGKLLNLNGACGKLNYAAPEVLQGLSFDPFAADVYSLGVMLWVLLCGHPCYDLEDEESPRAQRNARYALHYATGGIESMKQLLKAYGYCKTTEDQKGLNSSTYCPSDSVIDLLARLMSADPKNRPSLVELAKHPWLNEAL